MAYQRPPSVQAKEVSDGGQTEVISVKPVAVLSAALSQLNELDAFGGARGQAADGTAGSLPHEEAELAPRSADPEIAPNGPAPKGAAAPVDIVSAGSHSRSSVSDLGRAGKQNVDSGRQGLLRERTGLESPSEKVELASSGAVLALPAVDDSPLSQLSLLVFGRAARQPRDHLPNSKAALGSSEQQTEIIAGTPSSTDYYSTLLWIIESATSDPGQLRRLVYEVARSNLQEQTRQGNSPLKPDDIEKRALALETAIARVESELSRKARKDMSSGGVEGGSKPPDELRARDILDDMKLATFAASSTNPVEVISEVQGSSDPPEAADALRPPEWLRNQLVLRPPAGDTAGLQSIGLGAASTKRPSLEVIYPEREDANAVRVRPTVWIWFVVWPLSQLIGAAGFCLALYLALAGRSGEQSAPPPQPSIVATAPSPPVEAARSSGIPLPSTYGVYAISNGRLIELQPLEMRAPDPRVQLSAEIKQATSSVLPDGKIIFVLFRRELVNSAPQKVAVRVVARVASTLKFSSGKPEASKPDASWRIRSNSFDFQVSPLNENREMVAVRPEDPDFALPSGRYVLIFNNLAYDFTVDGPITAAVQCLESFEAVNGPVFTECKPK